MDGIGSLSLESTFSLALLGSVSVGSIILLLVQTTKQLWPSLEGQWAVRVTFLYSMVAVAIAFRQLGADLSSVDTLLALFLGGCAAFLSAIAQYAFLFKRSVEGLPPPLDAEAPPAAFSSESEDDAETMTREQLREQMALLKARQQADEKDNPALDRPPPRRAATTLSPVGRDSGP